MNTFEHFDIDYNKQKYLIETRLSGALTRAKAAVYFKPAAGVAAGSEAARTGVPGG